MQNKLILLLTLVFAAVALPQEDEFQSAMQDYKKGDYQTAIPKLKKASESLKNPQDKASAYLTLGLIYQVLNDEENAKIQFSNAYVVNPDLTLDRDYYAPRTIELFGQAKQEGMLRLERGEQLYSQAKYEESLQQLHTGIRLIKTTSPQIDRVHIVKAHFTAAKIYQVLNQDSRAVEEFEMALILNPELPDLDPELYSGATIQLFQKAKLAGNQALNEARRLLASKEYDSAIQVLEKNSNLYFAKGTKKDAAFLLAKAYYSTQKEERAAEAVTALLNIDPAFEASGKETDMSFGEFFEAQKFKVNGIRPKILIVRGSNNPAHELAIRGFKDEIKAELAESSIGDFKNKMQSFQPQAIFTAGTDALHAIQKAKSKLPVVFTNVPRGETGGVKNSNIGGIYLEIPIESQFSFLTAVLPAARKVGMLYSEDGGLRLVEDAKRAGREYGLEIAARSLEHPDDLADTLNRLSGIDVFWLTLDNSVVNSSEVFQELLQLTSRKGIPVFAYHEALVEKGALLSVSSNFETMGKQAGELMQKLLSKPSVDTVPAVFPTLSKLAINVSVAKKLKVDLNPSVITSATLVYK